jgi:hypothetical protein
MIKVLCGPPPSNMDFDIHPSRILVKLGLEKEMVLHPTPSCTKNLELGIPLHPIYKLDSPLHHFCFKPMHIA